MIKWLLLSALKQEAFQVLFYRRTLRFSLSKVLFFVGFCLLLFAGCSRSSSHHTDLSDWMESKGKLRVLSTTAMVNELVKGVGGERVACLALIQGEIDPHAYELAKGDEEKISHADMLFYSGLGLEHGASLNYQLQHHPHAIAIGDMIRKRHPELIVTLDSTVDPHIWMDISLWSKGVHEVVAALSKRDPEGADLYKKNGEALVKKWEQSHEAIRAAFLQIPEEERYLVTSHSAFNYFVRAYLSEEQEWSSEDWKKRFMAPEGLAPDGQLSAAHIQGIVDFIVAHHLQVIFAESNMSRDSLQKIAAVLRSRGVDVLVCTRPLYGDAMGELAAEPDGYLKMIQRDAEVILEEWKHAKK